MKNKMILGFVLLVVVVCFAFSSDFELEAETDTSKIIAAHMFHFSNIGFSTGKIIVYNGFFPYLEKIIPDTALAILTKEELQLLRNTIYAKHGLIFQSNNLKNHFQKFNWYKPKNNNVDDKLTEIDKINIESIQIFEKARPDQRVTKKDLVGSWLDSFPAAGNSSKIIINNNNTMEFSGCKGTYTVENGFLIIGITEQHISFGDYFLTEDYWWGGEITMFSADGNSGKIVFEKPVVLKFPIGNKEILSSGVKSRKIGSVVFFAPE